MDFSLGCVLFGCFGERNLKKRKHYQIRKIDGNITDISVTYHCNIILSLHISRGHSVNVFHVKTKAFYLLCMILEALVHSVSFCLLERFKEPPLFHSS